MTRIRWSPDFLRRRTPDILVLLALAIVFTLLARPLHRAQFGYDEHWFVWGGWAITAGQTPYIDFTDFKPPMGFLVNAAGIALFGLRALAFRYVIAYLVFAGLVLLYLAMRSRGHEPLLAACVTSLILYLILDPRFHDASLNDVETIGFGFFLSGISLLLMVPGTRWQYALGGFLLGAAVMTKEPFLLSAAPSLAACVLMRPASGRNQTVRAFMWAAGGAIACGLSVAAYLAIVGGLTAYVDVIVSYRRFAGEYCVTLGRFRLSGFVDELRQNWTFLQGGMINRHVLGSLSPFLALGLVSTFVLRRAGAALAILAVLGGLYAVTLGHCFWIHYFVMAMGPLALLSVAGGDLAAKNLFNGSWAWVTRAGLALLLAYSIGPRLAEEAPKQYARPEPAFPPELVQFIRNTTSESDTIFTTGEPAIYAYTGRKSALTNGSYVDEFLAYLPGDTDEEKVAPALAELRRKKPKLVFFESALPEERKRRYFKTLFVPYVKAMGYQEVRPGLFVLADRQ